MTAGAQPFQIKLSSLLIWGLGLFWMLAMLSADFRDPTFFNPLYPAEGLHNWLSLPGALLGGSMIEIFGPVALLTPWLFLRIIIPPSGSSARWLLIYHALILLITSATLYALSGFSSDSLSESAMLLLKHGYLGEISSTWLETHLGASGGLLFSGVLFTYSGIHLIRVLSPLDLYPSVSLFFQQLPLLLNQNRKTGKRFQSRDSSIKKGPLVFQTRTSSNGKLNHPLQQTDE
ncbi:MAG: DNA translocase FtsK 4TM domain-containing protein [SAR324 cluster bacterium]|nr:DNA translocase FtsK 4TM domain-containing protein [SAR324 cluster bacterium]